MSEDEIAIMDGGRCILQLRGVRPFFSEKFGKKLTDSMVRRTLEGKRPKVSGLKSKAGKTFDARLVPDKQYGVGLSFDDLNRKKK